MEEKEIKENSEKSSGEKETEKNNQEKQEEKIVQRKEKIKNWLKDPYNFLFLAILVFAFMVRFYYFWLTKNQPLWWDESEYMSGAKGYAGVIDYKLQSIRMPGFSFILSLFFRLGIDNEPSIRFFALFIPSLLVILLIYLCLKEMYPDKRIALISTAIISVLWEHLFYSNRFHTENFGLIFEFLAIFILFRCYLKEQNLSFIKSKYSLIWILLFSFLSFLFRPGNIIFFPAVFLFVILLNKSKLITKKSLAIVVILIIAGVLSLKFIGMPKIFVTYAHLKNPMAWHSFSIFYGFYESYVSWIPALLFYAFILGGFLFFFNLYLLLPKLKQISKNSKDLDFKSDIFNFLIIFAVMFYFVFILRDPGIAYRWFFPFLTGMLAFTGKGIISFSAFLGGMIKNNKLTAFLIILITVLGVYTQIVHTDPIVNDKVDSYKQVKDAGLWIKENSNKNDVVISASSHQHYYYSERKIYDFYEMGGGDRNESIFWENITIIKPKYLVVSVFEPGFTPQWAYDWPQRNNESVQPVQVYFLDPEQTQPALVIYEFIK